MNTNNDSNNSNKAPVEVKTLVQYWTHHKTGETFAVHTVVSEGGWVCGVCGPLQWDQCPILAEQGDWQFEPDPDMTRKFDEIADEFFKTDRHPSADLIN